MSVNGAYVLAAGGPGWVSRLVAELPGLLGLLAAGLVVYWAGLVVATALLLRRPSRRTYASEIARGRPGDPGEMVPARGYGAWSVRSRGREIWVWDIRGGAAEGPVCVMVHGWGDSKVGAMARLEAVEARCSRVVAIDLPGHGKSGGWARLGADEHVDVMAVLEVMGREGTRAGRPWHRGTGPVGDRSHREHVVLFGWSMGAGVCVRVAAELARREAGGDAREGPRVVGVIAETPYLDPVTPARNVMRARRLPAWGVVVPAQWINGVVLGVGARWRGFDRLGPARTVGAAGVAVLVVHGTADEVCPVEHGRRLVQAVRAGGGEAAAAMAEVEGGGHNDLWSAAGSREVVVGSVRGFVERVNARRGVTG